MRVRAAAAEISLPPRQMGARGQDHLGGRRRMRSQDRELKQADRPALDAGMSRAHLKGYNLNPCPSITQRGGRSVFPQAISNRNSSARKAQSYIDHAIAAAHV